MPGSSTSRACLRAFALLWCTATLAGCASWQLPRIDPSGERFFIWPNEAAPPAIVGPPTVVGPPAIVAPPVGAPMIAPSPAAPVVAPPVTAPFGNVQAPPVYSDPPGPTFAPAPAGVVSPFAPAPVPAAPPVITAPLPPVITAPAPPTTFAPPAALPITPVVPAGTPNVATPLGAVAPTCTDYLRVTPAGVMAPVGSEVVLKAGICGADGYLVTNRQVHWTIDRSGVGQFGDLGGREPLLSPGRWNSARLIDPWNASGSTSYSPIQLTRGTAEPNDDVGVDRGDSWVTVTSVAEGTSYVTACTPGMNQWNRATATIYWVDAQWQIPPSACVEPGRPHVLTTTVVRRTNGAPLAGWLVRYDVSTGASLGYEGGNTVEVPTDANGRASVEVSPAEPGGGTTNVGITIVRPEIAGPVPSPRLEFGRGNVPVVWGAAAAPAVPPSIPITPAPTLPPTTSPYTTTPVSPPPPLSSEPRPTLPSGPTTTDPYTPPADAQPAGRPQLEINLRRTGPEQVGVGEYAGFEVTLTNRGTGPARGIRVRDRFDTGLRHPSAKPNEFAVEYPGIRDLPANESTTIPLTFQVVAGGTHCHEVTVTAEGAEPVSARACVTARQAALEITVTAPRTRVVGEIAQFNVVVKNTGEVAASKVEIVSRYDAALEPNQAPADHERLADGSVLLRIDRLEAGERRAFSTTAVCRAPSNRACNTARVTAEGGVVAASEGCVEILPTLSTPPGGQHAPGPP
jgi:hypothetical protein